MKFSVHEMSWFGAKRAFVVKTSFENSQSPVSIWQKLQIFLNLGEDDAVPDRRSVLLRKALVTEFYI